MAHVDKRSIRNVHVESGGGIVEMGNYDVNRSPWSHTMGQKTDNTLLTTEVIECDVPHALRQQPGD